MELDKYYLLIVVLMVFGVINIILHNRAYQKLYNTLKKRGVISSEFAPDWTSKVGALGCMGHITRIKKDMGVDELNMNESSLILKTATFYKLGTFTTFAAVCLLFLKTYGLLN